MKISRATTKEIIVNLAMFTILVTAFSVGYFIFYGVSEPFLWLLAIPFFSMYAIRKKIHNPIWFTILTLAIGVIFGLVIASDDSRIFVWGILIISAGLSFFIKANAEFAIDKFFNICAFVIMAALLLLLQGFARADVADMQLQLVAATLAVSSLSIIYMHMGNIDLRLNILEKISGHSKGHLGVLSFNNKMIILFMSVVSGVGISFALWHFVWRIAAWLTVWLGDIISESADTVVDIFVDIGLMHHLTDEEFNQWQEGHVGYLQDLLLDGRPTEDFDTSPELIQNILEIISFIAIPLVVGGIIWLFYRHFKNRTQPKEATTTDTDDTTTLPNTFATDLRQLIPKLQYKNLHPIRRAYKKAVGKYIKAGTGILRTDTTNIIADKINPIEDISQLTKKYEKVRYGK